MAVERVVKWTCDGCATRVFKCERTLCDPVAWELPEGWAAIVKDGKEQHHCILCKEEDEDG